MNANRKQTESEIGNKQKEDRTKDKRERANTSSVGSADGSVVGFSVGDVEGDMLGVSEGASEGSVVGFSVGDVEGCLLCSDRVVAIVI